VLIRCLNDEESIMKGFFVPGLLFLGFALTGCNREPAKPPENKGVIIQTPDVDVKAGIGGVSVKAPGVNINVTSPK
jgi:hypothetical protein